MGKLRFRLGSSQPWAVLSLGGHLAMSTDISLSQLERGATFIQRVEAKHSAMCKITPHNKELSSPKC